MIEICPGDWVYGVTKCFLFDGVNSRNWQEAHDFCDGLDAVTLGNGDVIGPSLAFLENQEEFALSKTHLPNSWVWSNCNKLNINAPWVCVTDRAGTTSQYRDWGPGQPEDDRCVISYQDQMHDQDCNINSGTGTSCQVNISA
ncbi:macrophage mannose receptor 1-like [Strongylocentrotus purpuratus]|uniref:C-type lectin domain-containing protein n=1 Tax=Strongylocentrotus purpuratus TaxID=7668 RepID=A0A7M7PF42_STRPU|nr:macrophage mannose receptor 1-like [Strongylocentrotus purpuratus]